MNPPSASPSDHPTVSAREVEIKFHIYKIQSLNSVSYRMMEQRLLSGSSGESILLWLLLHNLKSSSFPSPCLSLCIRLITPIQNIPQLLI